MTDTDDLLRVTQCLKSGLARIARTADGTGYAYCDLDIEMKDLKDLYNVLENYPHLRYINVSKNALTHISAIQAIDQLMVVNAAKNSIENLSGLQDRAKLNCLEILNLSNNKITELTHIALPALKKLNLNDNQIKDCSAFKGHHGLEILEIRRNKIPSLQGLGQLPVLKELYCAENECTSLEPLTNLPSLTRLHIRQNQIECIDVKQNQFPQLEYFNLRGNKIANFAEFEKIKVVNLNAKENPCAEESGDASKKQILMVLYQQLHKCNKEEVTPEEKEEVINEIKERQEEERRREEEQKRIELERERLAKIAEEEEARRVEEEARRKLEEEEAEAKRQAEKELQEQLEQEKLKQKEKAEEDGEEDEENQEQE